MTVKEVINNVPTVLVLFGASGIGKTGVSVGLEQVEGPNMIDPLGYCLATAKNPAKVLHIDLENPASSGAIKCNTIHLPKKTDYTSFIASYRTIVTNNLIAVTKTKGKLPLKPDGTPLKEDFNAENLSSILNSPNPAMVELGEKVADALNMVRNGLTEEEKDAVYPFKYAVVDVFSKISDWSEEWAADEFKSTTIGKNFVGDNIIEHTDSLIKWKLHREVAISKVEELCELFPHLILIAHTRDKYVEGKAEGQELVVKEIDIIGKLANILFRKVDAVGKIYRTPKGQLNVNFKQDSTDTAAKGRCRHMWDYNGVLDWNMIYQLK
jgi:hypothetical protein